MIMRRDAGEVDHHRLVGADPPVGGERMVSCGLQPREHRRYDSRHTTTFADHRREHFAQHSEFHETRPDGAARCAKTGAADAASLAQVGHLRGRLMPPHLA